jgi:site-specific recombinase XerD
MNTDHLIVELAGRPRMPGDAELAAVAFRARYNGRTLEAYQHDLRDYFGWAESNGLPVLYASRADIELYRHHMEQRALAASTIDRR